MYNRKAKYDIYEINTCKIKKKIFFWVYMMKSFLMKY